MKMEPVRCHLDLDPAPVPQPALEPVVIPPCSPHLHHLATRLQGAGDARWRILEHQAIGRSQSQPAGSQQIRLGIRLAPADVTENGKQPIVGAAVLMFQRGDKLLGFTKHVADTICSEWL